jgi:hypothetical protein
MTIPITLSNGKLSVGMFLVETKHGWTFWHFRGILAVLMQGRLTFWSFRSSTRVLCWQLKTLQHETPRITREYQGIPLQHMATSGTDLMAAQRSIVIFWCAQGASLVVEEEGPLKHFGCWKRLRNTGLLFRGLLNLIIF